MTKEINSEFVSELIQALLPLQSFKAEELSLLNEEVEGAPMGMIFITGPYGVYYGVAESQDPPRGHFFGPFYVHDKKYFANVLSNYTVFKKFMEELSWNKDGDHTLSEDEYKRIENFDIYNAIEWQYRCAFRHNRREVSTEETLWYQAPDFKISVKESKGKLEATMQMYSLKISPHDPYKLIYDEEIEMQEHEGDE